MDKIIQSMPNKDLPLVEIGPGLGDLTKKLLSIQVPLKCIEIDADLIKSLQRSFAQEIKENKLELIHADALMLQAKGLSSHEYALVANLPYYLATKLILNALDDDKCRFLLVLVQKEVALRFTQNSAIGVLAAAAGKASVLFDVPNTAFTPPPKVTSSVLLVQKSGSKTHSEEGFKQLLRLCFKSPRKQLLSSLDKANKQAFASIFSVLGISTRVRPGELDVKSYLEIYKHIKEELWTKNTIPKKPQEEGLQEIPKQI